MNARDKKEIERIFLKAHDDYADALFRHCYFKVSDRELAYDLTQETFTRTWAFLADGGEIGNVRAFLYRVANNLIIDEYRKKKASSLDVMRDDGFDVGSDESARLTDMLDGERAVHLLSKLDTKYSEVIFMRYVDDLSPKEIATVLGTSENTVSVRLHRGLKQLRGYFEAYD